MKRVALALVAVAVLCIASSQAQAAGVAVTVGGWGAPTHVVHHHHPRVVRRPVFVHPPVIYRPRVVVPAYPRVIYPPVYSVPRAYYGGPSGSFYYHGPGLSLGIGF